MIGPGILKGLGVTFKHFIETYLEDLRWIGRKRYIARKELPARSGKDARGILPSNTRRRSCPHQKNSATFHSWSMMKENGEKVDRCTSCGICAKVCPPQCIWIVRTNDPVTGRPIPSPAEFYIDVDICMNCGLCAEFCPFDAIKMDHDYEIASYDRYCH